MLLDFVILEMEEDTSNLLFLGGLCRPPQVSIDVENGKLSFDIGDDCMEFNMFKASKFPSISEECHRIDVNEQY